MLKSEWNDSSSLQELTAEETFHVSGGYAGDPVNTGPPQPPLKPSAADVAFYAAVSAIVARQGYITPKQLASIGSGRH